MAMSSGAAGAEAGATGVSVDGGGGADSAPSPLSSWTVVGGGELALGGLFLKDPPPCGDIVGGMGALAVLLLLKTIPPLKSSSSEKTSSTLFPFSRGAGAGDEATASGTAAMGGGELGVWSVWGLCGGGEDGPSGVSVVVGVGEVNDRGRFGSAVGMVEAAAFEARAFKAFARATLLDESITDPASDKPRNWD